MSTVVLRLSKHSQWPLKIVLVYLRMTQRFGVFQWCEELNEDDYERLKAHVLYDQDIEERKLKTFARNFMPPAINNVVLNEIVEEFGGDDALAIVEVPFPPGVAEHLLAIGEPFCLPTRRYRSHSEVVYIYPESIRTYLKNPQFSEWYEQWVKLKGRPRILWASPIVQRHAKPFFLTQQDALCIVMPDLGVPSRTLSHVSAEQYEVYC